MFAIHATYRGRRKRRAEFVEQAAVVLSEFEHVHDFTVLGVEDMRAPVTTAEALVDVTMALLASNEWAVGLGVADDEQLALELATTSLQPNDKAGVTKLRIDPLLEQAQAETLVDVDDVTAIFELLRFVMSKRSYEGQEATSLLRRGYTQTEAAKELGISKQAMSQRVQAAGWQAEARGRRLAIHMLANIVRS